MESINSKNTLNYPVVGFVEPRPFVDSKMVQNHHFWLYNAFNQDMYPVNLA